jgi:UDP-glucose 4-epimerase
VADAGRIRAQLGWTPRFDNLDTIVGHAMAWEQGLASMRERAAARGGRG